MALNAGDMLYYDGSQWVNSPTIKTSMAGLTLDISDAATTTVAYAAKLSHSTSQAGSIGVPYGVGMQFIGSDTGGNPQEIGTIECAQATVGPGTVTASFHSFFERDGSGNLLETLRLGSTGFGAAAFFRVPLLGRNVPFQLNLQLVDLTGGGIITMSSGQSQSPILEMYNAAKPSTVVFPMTFPGAFWIVHNATSYPLTLTSQIGVTQTLATEKRAIFYTSNLNQLQRITPDT
jgi:hypothetical protein